jgi:aconitate hydratase
MASAQRAGNAPQSSSEQRGLGHGSVVIAAITSCTNTANPAVMVAAGLLARRAHARGLQVPPWVKTSLAPGSRVVTDYLRAAGLLAELETLGFNVVGYGCTTCIGNSGPLAEPVSKALEQGELLVCSVLSGNRNFEGRVHAQVPLNYLASPPLVVAYALAGRMDIDLASEPLGVDAQGAPVWLRELWPSQHEVNETIAATVGPDLYRERYAEVFAGDEHWRALEVASGDLYAWEAASTYILEPPYFQGMHRTPAPLESIRGGRVLALLGDSVTTDHISPAGSIAATGPAGRYLVERGVEPKDFNAYGARRGNHEVMMRGTFANTRLRNLLAPEKVGGWTTHQPSGEQMTIFDAAMRYQAEGVPMLVLAGREYGTGSSRDWAAKGPRLLGVRAVIAESYERIHRSNLVGMGILPLQFAPGENAASLGLNGTERYDVEDVRSISDQRTRVTARSSNGGEPVRFTVAVRIDTPQEWEYYRHGGILPYVLRRLLENA